MDITNVGVGVYDRAAQQTDPTHKASRVSIRPSEVGLYGAYTIALASGVMAAGLAAGSPIYAFRWAQSSPIGIIRRVRITGGTDTVAFAQGSTIFDLIRATGFTVQDTGGAVISLASKSQAMATRFSASQIQIAASAGGQIAIASTATLTAGTRTLDSNPLAILVGSAGAVPANFPITGAGYLIDPGDTNRQPLELQQSEGFVIRATVPGTGTWKFGVEVSWDEADPARYF